MSVLNKYKKYNNPLVVIKDKYWDFVLSHDSTTTIMIDSNNTTDCLSSFIDFTNTECHINDGFASLADIYWENAINSGITLDNIGFTGIDNGTILYDKNTITEEEFIDIVQNSTLSIDENDIRLAMYPVNGNTQFYKYDLQYIDGKYISFKGGFIQGQYKQFDHDYEVLPSVFEDSLDMEFVLRPMDYPVDRYTLNFYHPENKGIFFYWGTRAENKFAEMRGADLSQYPDRDLGFVPPCFEYAEDDYYIDDYLEPVPSADTDSSTTVEYITDIIDSNGFFITEDMPHEIETDNKYLYFNRTLSGMTVDKYDRSSDSRVKVVAEKHTVADENLFLLMNRTLSGYTVDTIGKYADEGMHLSIDPENGTYEVTSASTENTDSGYNIIDDITNNSFALQINDDMSIGYKYLIKDCDAENRWSITEEVSKPNIISNGEWNVIHVKYKMLNGGLDDCGNQSSDRKMKIYIYVNGYLKLVSKELPAFNFRELNEKATLQEGVPFSMSLGGGTQGLCDSIWGDYRNGYFNKILPIEENFAGSFLGDMRKFKIYTCGLQYNQIKNNYLYEKIQWQS